MEINKERLEAWLFSQPDDRTWNYHSTLDCVLCSFIKESTNIKQPIVGGCYWNESMLSRDIPIPRFAIELLSKTLYGSYFSMLIAKELKVTWLTMFPEAQEPVAVNVGEKVNQ